VKRLNFDDEYVRSILDGEKVTTIRKGVKDYQVNEIVELTVNHKPFAKARILDVVVKRVNELRTEDAIKDGFKSREDLLQTLKKIYGNLENDDVVTIIRFNIIDKKI